MCRDIGFFPSLSHSFCVLFLNSSWERFRKVLQKEILTSQQFNLAARHSLFYLARYSFTYFVAREMSISLQITQYVIVKCVTFHSCSNQCHNQLLDLCSFLEIWFLRFFWLYIGYHTVNFTMLIHWQNHEFSHCSFVSCIVGSG